MFKLLKNLKRKEWLLIFLSIGFVVAQVYMDLELPYYMRKITEILNSGTGKSADIWKNGGIMLAYALGSVGISVGVGLLAAKVAASFSQRVREKVFSRVQKYSMHEINKFSISSLITRSTNDISQIQQVVAIALQVMTKAPIMIVWAITDMISNSWEFSVLTGIAVAVMLVVMVVLITVVIPKYNKIQKTTDWLNRVTRENLTGIRVVRAYNAEEFEAAKFENVNDKLTKINLTTTKMMGLMQPTMVFITNMLSLSIYWVGAILISNIGSSDLAHREHELRLFSDMVTFNSYAMQVVMSVIMLSFMFVLAPRASVSAKRVNEVLDLDTSVVDGPLTEMPADIHGEIEFKNVAFSYEGAEENIIEGISFKVNKGETVAFIGSTGSGKSTLINLIPRFYDVTEGEVLVNGVNVKEYSLESLRNILGYVSQKAVMFSGTVNENIAYGENGKGDFESKVEEAIEIAQAKSFVEKMDGQYEAHLAQGGTNVSGGQKQRLSIARAIARTPEIYIFDDTFSALDYKTDRTLRSALKASTSGATSLIVAQRIGTIKDADKIIVLDHGKIAGMGTHKELLNNCKVYTEIAYSQLSKEELENE